MSESEYVPPFVDPVSDVSQEIVPPFVPNVEPIEDVPAPIVEPVMPFTGDDDVTPTNTEVKKSAPAKRKTKRDSEASEV